MDKLLIAVQSDTLAQYLVKAFQSEFEIRSCCDGCDALQLLSDFRPHAMILSLRLPRKDSITLLEQSCHIPPVILGIADHSDPYGFHAAQRLGMGRILVTPTVNTVVVALTQMRMDLDPRISGDPAMRSELILHSLGFLANLDGFMMLRIGIPMAAKDPAQKLSKSLYPMIAEQLGICDSRSVEASIRRSIEKAWKRRDNAVWGKFFPPDREGNIPCPTNAQFIKRLAQQIRL